MSRDPLILGAWLKPGQHLDLVGGYREDMREADDAAVARSRIFVDARFTAAAHAGDISQPLAAGLIADADITDTFQLARGERPGRRTRRRSRSSNPAAAGMRISAPRNIC